MGGALACNLSGPRRIKAGAARDHFLGFRGVSGRGEIFKAGGKVVKNVTGYDLCKLMAGSYGTLAALEEVTVKVLPQPEASCTVMLCGIDPAAAAWALNQALGSPHEISGAAYLPAGLYRGPGLTFGEAGCCGASARRSRALGEFSTRTTARRILSGLRSHNHRDRGLNRLLARDPRPGAARGARRTSTFGASRSRRAAAPNSPERLSHALDASWYLDWGGGLLWIAVAGAEDGGATVIRAAIRGADGRGTGHATLISGSPALRRSVPVFEPQPPALAALADRVKEGFDPRRILNPGRMVEGR